MKHTLKHLITTGVISILIFGGLSVSAAGLGASAANNNRAANDNKGNAVPVFVTTGESPRAGQGPGNTVASTSQPANNRDLPQRMADFSQRVEQARQQAQQRVAAVKQRMENRIAAIQNKVKQQLAARIATQFDHLNQVWTEHFTNVLNRYDAILQKIQDRANAAQAAGKDTTTTDAAIKTAQDAISNARASVVAQAAKTYDISETTTTATTTGSTSTDSTQIIKGLQNDFQGMRQQLFSDLSNLRSQVQAVRQPVVDALTALSKIQGINEVKTATTTASSATSSSQSQ